MHRSKAATPPMRLLRGNTARFGDRSGMVPIDHAAIIPNRLIGNAAAEICAPLVEIERQEKGLELVQIIAVQELKRTNARRTLRRHSKLVQDIHHCRFSWFASSSAESRNPVSGETSEPGSILPIVSSPFEVTECPDEQRDQSRN